MARWQISMIEKRLRELKVMFHNDRDGCLRELSREDLGLLAADKQIQLNDVSTRLHQRKGGADDITQKGKLERDVTDLFKAMDRDRGRGR